MLAVVVEVVIDMEVVVEVAVVLMDRVETYQDVDLVGIGM